MSNRACNCSRRYVEGASRATRAHDPMCAVLEPTADVWASRLTPRLDVVLDPSLCVVLVDRLAGARYTISNVDDFTAGLHLAELERDARGTPAMPAREELA